MYVAEDTDRLKDRISAIRRFLDSGELTSDQKSSIEYRNVSNEQMEGVRLTSLLSVSGSHRQVMMHRYREESSRRYDRLSMRSELESLLQRVTGIEL